MVDDRKIRFAREYVKDLNPRRAYLAVYKNVKKMSTADSNSSRLLKDAKVKKEVERLQNKVIEKTELTLEKIVNEVSALAFSKVSDYMDVEDNEIRLRDWSKLTPEQLAAVQEVSIVKEKYFSKEDKTIQIIKFKLADKRPNLELLGRRFNAFPNKLQLTDKDDKPIEITEIVVKRTDGAD